MREMVLFFIMSLKKTKFEYNILLRIKAMLLNNNNRLISIYCNILDDLQLATRLF